MRRLLAGFSALAAACAQGAAPEAAPSRDLPLRFGTGEAAAPAADGTAAPSEPGAALARALLDRGLRERGAYEYLASLLGAAPKRLSGSQGFADAARWGERTMRAMGLEGVRLEPVMVPCWERGGRELAVASLRDGSRVELRACALGGSPATPPGGVTAPVVRFESVAALEAAGDGVQGRIVFLDQPMDPAARTTGAAYGAAAGQRTRGPALAAARGAVAAVIRSLSTAQDDAPHTGATSFDEKGPRIPALALGVQSAERLATALAADLVENLTVETACRVLPDREQWNVVGEIPGARWPEQIVLLGAHLDAWDLGDGAHDDGSGCAQVLEAARLLRAAGARPARTVRVVLFANEENGLRGGRAYAEAHGGERHFAALESDSGGDAPRGIGLDVPEAAVARLRPLGAPLAEVGAERVLRGGGGADISPLAARGVPLGSLRVDDARYFDVHHSERDVLASVHPRELELGAVVLAYWAAVLADLEAGALAP